MIPGFAVLIREIARSIAVAWTGLRLKAIFFLPVGGVMALIQRGGPNVPPASLPTPVTLVGPIANLAVGLLMAALCYAISPHVPLLSQPWISPGHILRSFIWFQFLVGFINLLPTATMPSAQLFRTHSSRSTDPKPAKTSTPACLTHLSTTSKPRPPWSNTPRPTTTPSPPAPNSVPPPLS